MNWVVSIYTAILFFILTPNVLVRLPPKGSLMMVAAVHAIIFAVIYHYSHMAVWKMSMPVSHKDGFTTTPTIKSKCPSGQNWNVKDKKCESS